jgi:hypothetical protein
MSVTLTVRPCWALACVASCSSAVASEAPPPEATISSSVVEVGSMTRAPARSAERMRCTAVALSATTSGESGWPAAASSRCVTWAARGAGPTTPRDTSCGVGWWKAPT